MFNLLFKKTKINALKFKCLCYYILLLFTKPILNLLFSKKNIWLIGENSGVNLKDNGYCFFRYCIEKENKKNIYLIIKKNNFNFKNSNISRRYFLEYYSFRHIVFLFFSDVLIYTHTHRDIIFHTFFSLIKRNKKIIFLKHGVTGFKRFYDTYQKDRDEMNILVSVSNFEKNILNKNLDVKSEKIQVTGYPRYDYLLNKCSSKQIVYMPTWRDWIDIEDIHSSPFFIKINSFLQNPNLHNLLNKSNTTLKLYLHVKMAHFSHSFSTNSNNIQIITFGDESVQELIAFSNLLITDYSSVSWDFFYLNKPTIFYQFDRNTYLKKRGSYLDFENDLFGESASNEEDLISIINSCVSSAFKIKDNFLNQHSTFFKYKDKLNSHRLYTKILELE